METITSSLKSIIFNKNDYLIGEFEDNLIAKGPMTSAQVGMDYKLTGKWIESPKYGQQFQFQEYRSAYPKSLQAIRRYLKENCQWIGPAISHSLIQAYGEDTIKICKDHPSRVALQIKGITLSRAEVISVWLKDNEKHEELILQLNTFLVESGVNKRSIGQILTTWGTNAMNKIKDNPYSLIEAVDGIGFTLADRVAHSLGYARQGKERFHAAVFHVLKEATRDGHTYLKQPLLEKNVVELLGCTTQHEYPSNLSYDGDRVMLNDYFDAELSIAKKLLDLSRVVPDASPVNTDGLAEDQIDAMKKVMGSNIFILTGAPGTGKTHMIKRIIDSFPDKTIALAAPSGKAALRMYEATGHEASTLHRLLGAEITGRGFQFAKNQENPLTQDLIIIDESSMLDTKLFAQFLDAVQLHTRLILVGDTYQLPSVGAGNVLKDMIESNKIPYKELTIIKRQQPGLIITNCHRIKDGKDIEVDNGEGSDFFFLEHDNISAISSTIINLVSNRLPDHYDVDPMKDIQVISPLRSSKILGCDDLNQALQQKLNQSQPVDKTKFRIGDKVVQNKNDYNNGILNGDIGYVKEIDPTNQKMRVLFDQGQDVSIKLFDNHLALAYCTTVHKYQGSEAPIIILPAHESLGSFIPQRNLLYTAISRAKRCCVIVGQRKEVHAIIGRNSQQGRFTNLKRQMDRNAHGIR